MVGENFEIYLPQMTKNEFKFSNMVGDNFEIYRSQMPKNVFKLSTLFGENYCPAETLRLLCRKNSFT